MSVIFLLNLSIFIPLLGLSNAKVSTNFFHSLSRSQEELLNHLKPCTFRFVYLENSISAAEDIRKFVDYYHKDGAFILESIPAHIEYILPNRTYQITRYNKVKFMSCYTIFYFQDQLFEAIAEIKELNPAEILSSYFKNYPVQLRKENPPFVVFVTFGKNISSIHYDHVHKIDTTSSFYVLFIDGVKLICASCGDYIFHEPKYILSDSAWREMYVRYGKISVCNWVAECDRAYVNSLFTCTVYPQSITKSFYLGAGKCLFRVLKQKLNTTESHEWLRADGSAIYLTMISRYVKTLLIEHNNYDRIFEPVSYGMSVTRYRFGTLTNLGGQDISCLTRPFDEFIWLCLFLSTIGVCSCLEVVSRVTKNWFISKIHLISIMLEQSQSIVTKGKCFRKKIFFLILPWMLLSFLLGNTYKGVMFSFLTTPSIQKVPETLNEVVDSNLLIATLTYISDNIDGKTVKSAIAKIRVDSILENIKAGAIIQQNEDIYQKFKDSMLFVWKPVAHFFIAKETRAEMPSEKQGIIKNRTVPENFIIFDQEIFVNLFSELITIFTDDIFILGQSLDLFSQTEQLVLPRNAFLRLMSPIFSELEEAGIYRRWQYFEDILFVNKAMSDTRKRAINAFNASKIRFSSKDNILAYLLFKPYTAKTVTKAVPISLEYFTVFALFYVYCTAVCGVAFILETLTKIGFKHFVLTFRNQIRFWFQK